MTDLIERLNNESDLCRNDGANDIADLLDEAIEELKKANIIMNMVLNDFHISIKYPSYDINIIEDWINRNGKVIPSGEEQK